MDPFEQKRDLSAYSDSVRKILSNALVRSQIRSLWVPFQTKSGNACFREFCGITQHVFMCIFGFSTKNPIECAGQIANPFTVGPFLVVMSFCKNGKKTGKLIMACLLYTSPSPRDKRQSRMPSSA